MQLTRILHTPRMPWAPGSRNACTLAPALVSVPLFLRLPLRPAQVQVRTLQTRNTGRWLGRGETQARGDNRAASTWRAETACCGVRPSPRVRCGSVASAVDGGADHDGVAEVLNKARHGCSRAVSMRTASCGSSTCCRRQTPPPCALAAAAGRGALGGAYVAPTTLRRLPLTRRIRGLPGVAAGSQSPFASDVHPALTPSAPTPKVSAQSVPLGR